MKIDGKLILLLVIVLGVLYLIHVIRKKFKVLDLPCVFFISGEVKSGKTFLGVHLAVKEYKRNLRRFRLRMWLKGFFRLPYSVDEWGRCEKDYPPMLYSNMKIAGVKFNRLTIEIIERKVRIPPKSVVFIDEVSLLADSQLYKYQDINDKLMVFYKLFGHYSHGGKLILDSQSMSDNHYSAKRCMGSYLYIFNRVKYPFISMLYVRQLAYMDDNGGTVNNAFNEDIEDSMKKVIVFNRTYDRYDCYALSVFTDFLDYEVNYDVEELTKKDDLKTYYLVSLNPYSEKLNQSIKGWYSCVPFTDKADVKNANVGMWIVDDNGVVCVKEGNQNENI